jgi:hypothetical protein
LRRALGLGDGAHSAWGRALACVITFVAVVIGWVIFRADSLATAQTMLSGMAGFNGSALPDHWLAKWGALGAWLSAHGVTFNDTRGMVTAGLIYWLIALLLVVWLAPNTQQIMRRAKPVLDTLTDSDAHRGWHWRPAPWLAAPLAVLALAVVVNLHKKSEFLYFQF